MTIGQRIFFLLDEKQMTQREFSARTGIATTTISDWRKKNTNPGADKIMAICNALDVTPDYLLSGITEDSKRGRNVDYMVIPKGTEERELIDMFNDMNWLDRAHLLEYAKKVITREKESAFIDTTDGQNMVKIAEFCDIEIFMNSKCEGTPKVDINYLDDNVQGSMDITVGNIEGNFSKYVIPVIEAWYKDNKSQLIYMWEKGKVEVLPEWE